MTLVLRHDRGCLYAQDPTGDHTDAAKRVADGYNLHIVANRQQATGRWVAFDLAEGRSDGALYDTKPQAVAHQHGNDDRRLYIRMRNTSMTACEAASLLRTARMLYDLGNPQNTERVIIPRLTNEHQARQVARLRDTLRWR
jgi:hypothetical protein